MNGFGKQMRHVVLSDDQQSSRLHCWHELLEEWHCSRAPKCQKRGKSKSQARRAQSTHNQDILNILNMAARKWLRIDCG